MTISLNIQNMVGMEPYYRCPRCGSGKTYIKDYDPSWHDGQVHCSLCNTYIREYDAG